MTLHEYAEVEQRSEEWYGLRRGIITASTVGQLITAKTLSVADNDTSRALTAQLAAERITGTTDPTFTNDNMMRGVLDEPLAVEAYAKHYDTAVTTTGFMVRREDDWTLGYSPDGLVGDDGLIEVKCPRAKGHLRTIIADRMPAYHMAQVQAGLLVSGRKWCDFISYYGGMPMYVTQVEWDPAWRDAIVAACQTFEANVAAMLATYEDATKDMPATERMEVVI